MGVASSANSRRNQRRHDPGGKVLPGHYGLSASPVGIRIGLWTARQTKEEEGRGGKARKYETIKAQQKRRIGAFMAPGPLWPGCASAAELDEKLSGTDHKKRGGPLFPRVQRRPMMRRSIRIQDEGVTATCWTNSPLAGWTETSSGSYPDTGLPVDEVAANSVSAPPVGLDHQFRQWDLLQQPAERVAQVETVLSAGCAEEEAKEKEEADCWRPGARGGEEVDNYIFQGCLADQSMFPPQLSDNGAKIEKAYLSPCAILP
ncbi:hypothetical protein WN51_13836 [Melipona quadrifasciata]|uniref:Uncharacterized protein n=1 Tax=Melipona quadrifasciata TaxID=166423 RepID=A0A0N0U5A4_9HYME|nr:hypothetical protein WN51_13836 [Melipona quadrifasciata]